MTQATETQARTAPQPAVGDLYQRLRGQLLQEALRHRKGAQSSGMAGDAHRMHRRTCQRQLGALRQAYRRTTEVAAWQAYAATKAEGQRPQN